MRNTIILTAVLFITVIAATIYYFKNLDNEHSQSSRSLRYLPQNTLFIAAVGNDETSENVFKDFEIFDAILGVDNMKLWNDFKTIILNTEKSKTYIADSDIYISFHPEDKKIVPLFTIPSSTDIPSAELVGMVNEISKTFKTTTIDTLGQKIFQIKYGEKDSILNAFYFKDILFATPSISLIPKIVDKHSKHLSEDQIEFFLKNNPRNTPLSIYFPHQQYDSIVDITQRNNKGPFINLFRKLQGQSAWNINFKQDALILTGESQLDQYPDNFASIFKNQAKAPQDLYTYFPSNTAIYAEFSISNRPTFQKDLHNLQKRREEKVIEQIDTTKAAELITKALGNQFALVETNAQNYIGFVKINDSLAFQSLTKTIMESTGDSIGRFATSGILYKHYGDPFKDFQRPYYTVVDSVMIVANNLSTLRAYRKDYFENDLLTGTLGFIKLEKLQGKEANITIFAHTKNASSKFLNSLNQPFRDNYKNKENYGFQDFFSWSIQLSGNNGNISSQIYGIYKSKNTLGTVAEWSIELGNKAITQPFIFNQSDTNQFILIQQLDHTIHAIHPSGKEMWSKVFAGRVIGNMQQLEDRSILLITDKNNLYRFDTEGKSLKGFPVNIQSTATASPLITIINGEKVILVPTTDKVLAYDLNGNTLKNWNSFTTDGKITTTIIAHEKHYIIGTNKGNIYWLNENGQKTNEVKLNNTGVKNIEINSNYKIVALDDKGGLNLFSNEKEHQRWRILADSIRYIGDFGRITNTTNSNVVIVNSNELQVFDIADTLKTAIIYNFTKPITDELQFFSNTQNKDLSYLGIASKSTNLLYLINETGQLVNGFPVEGQPLFYYGKIDYNSEIYLLCMRRDHKLYAFKQKK
ncbi:hypothetical protein [Sphingobacterium rhinopitheci]|uniref:hypothetical protein n=1 Tax=Sphingobacterium rhinopitheci TaxID=2781960 RepID=UPI001F51CAE5|nr:hypothetical protein [Sphingobacterium rhinopitheci]MCI0920305.1 hypothetical protein [Sphingobacterium rhinopitheci]